MKYFLFLSLIIPTTVLAQVNITGKVLANVSGEPLVGVSVYINNSTIGTTTNENGIFELQQIVPGTYEIIVSHIGYEPLLHRVEIKAANLKFIFRLEAKVEQMRNILVMSDEKRRKMMTIFKEQFLGITVAGEKCSIENEREIMFEPGNGKSDIYAFADQPLIVINRELGYRILFDLQEFYLDQSTGRTFFYGYSKYEDLEKGNTEKYRKKRRQYYMGSTMHFYHSLFEGKAKENQFRVIQIITYSNNIERYVDTLKNDPKNFVYTDKESKRKYMAWDGKITVRYLQDPVYKNALRNKTMVEGALRKGIESELTMLEKPVFFTDQGLPEYPLRITFSGFWSYERLGNMLPINYRPEN
jgi:CarboxypepD_reg-like domain